jgi:methylmalonyl-CoA mutase C-terminal domain/subunit
VLVAKAGLDGHDKGAKVVAHKLREAGMEVIYTGIRQSVDSIVAASIQEGVDVIGLSILSGTHLPLCRQLMDKVRQAGLSGVLVVVGGIIPNRDVPKLEELGIARVFRPGSHLDEIAGFIASEVSRTRQRGAEELQSLPN